MSSSSTNESSSSSSQKHCEVRNLCRKVKESEGTALLQVIGSKLPNDDKLKIAAKILNCSDDSSSSSCSYDFFLKTVSKIYNGQTAIGFACEESAEWETFPEALFQYASLIVYLRLAGYENYSRPHAFECGQFQIGQFVLEFAGAWKWTFVDLTTGKRGFFFLDQEHPVVNVFETEESNSKVNSSELKDQGYKEVSPPSVHCPCDESTPSSSSSSSYFKDCSKCEQESSSSSEAGACGPGPCCDGFSNIDLSCMTKSLICKIERQRQLKCKKPEPLCPCNNDESSSSSSSDCKPCAVVRQEESSSSPDCKPCAAKKHHESKEERRTRRSHEREERSNRKHECKEREERSRQQCAEIRVKVCVECESSSSSSAPDRYFARDLASVLPPQDFVLTLESGGPCNKVVLRRVGAVFSVERDGLPTLTSDQVGILGVQKVWNADIMSLPFGKSVEIVLQVEGLKPQAVRFALPDCCEEDHDVQAQFSVHAQGNNYHYDVVVEDYRRTVLRVVDDEHHHREEKCHRKCESSDSVDPSTPEEPPAFVLNRCKIVQALDVAYSQERYSHALRELNCVLKKLQQGEWPSPLSISFSSWSSSYDLCSGYS